MTTISQRNTGSVWDKRARYIEQSTSALQRYVAIGDKVARLTKMKMYTPQQAHEADISLYGRLLRDEQKTGPGRMPERSSSTAHTSLTTGWGNKHLAISGVSHQPYVQTAHHSNAMGPGGSGMQDNGAGNFNTGVDFETLRQQWTGIAKEQEELNNLEKMGQRLDRIAQKEKDLKDIRDLKESTSKYAEDNAKFYEDQTEYLKKWGKTPISTTDPYNPPNYANDSGASTSTSGATSQNPKQMSFSPNVVNESYTDVKQKKQMGFSPAEYNYTYTGYTPKKQMGFSSNVVNDSYTDNKPKKQLNFSQNYVEVIYPNEQAVNIDPFVGTRSPLILKGKRPKMTGIREYRTMGRQFLRTTKAMRTADE